MIRANDSVVIINPVVIIRVGYPLSFAEALKQVTELYSTEAAALLDRVRPARRLGYRYDQGDDKPHALLLRTLAYEWLKNHCFGGNERTLHTEIDEELRGRCCQVRSVRTRCTGIRVPGWVGTSYEGEYDGESPYLSSIRTHRIAELAISRRADIWSGDPVCIEVTNLELCTPRPERKRKAPQPYRAPERIPYQAPEPRAPESVVVEDE